MDITIYPKLLSGAVQAIPSKSLAHRLMICAACADGPTNLICPETNQDIEATARCLQALGAGVTPTEQGYFIEPFGKLPDSACLDCMESGSTLRFLLPLAGALQIGRVYFKMHGRLPQRPLSPLWEEMERMGCRLSWVGTDMLLCEGQLKSGEYTINGGVSSQFITGLLLAMANLDGPSKLSVTGTLESAPYVTMTQQAMMLFGVETCGYCVAGGRKFHSPGTVAVEGDWSNAAFFLAANALGSQIQVGGLDAASAQGDRAIEKLLPQLRAHCTIQAADIPDLVPILAVVAGANKGAAFTGIRRLRLKESDRVESVAAMLRALGAEVETTQDTITVYPAKYRSCTVNSAGDHRIAMAAAMAATVADGKVTILEAQCTDKSYPSFWTEYERLGGTYEQHLR